MKRIVGFLICAVVLRAQQPISVALQTPAPPQAQVSAAVIGNSGGSRYTYWVVTNYPSGSVVSGPANVSFAPGVLTTTNYVGVSWTGQSGATSYDLIRLNPPASFGGSCSACAVVIGTTATSFSDNGGALTSYTSGAGAVNANGTIYINTRDYPAPQMRQVVNGADSAIGSGGGVGPVGPTGPTGPTGLTNVAIAFALCQQANCSTVTDVIIQPQSSLISGTFTPSSCIVQAATLPVGSNLTLQVIKNGSVADTYNVAPGGGATQTFTPVWSSVSSDFLTAQVSAVGSTTPGKNVTLECFANLQGVIGPVGPTGPTGATGPAGTNGTNGTNGAISTIQNNGTPETVRSILNWVDGTNTTAVCADNVTKTDCHINASAAGTTVVSTTLKYPMYLPWGAIYSAGTTPPAYKSCQMFTPPFNLTTSYIGALVSGLIATKSIAFSVESIDTNGLNNAVLATARFTGPFLSSGGVSFPLSSTVSLTGGNSYAVCLAEETGGLGGMQFTVTNGAMYPQYGLNPILHASYWSCTGGTSGSNTTYTITSGCASRTEAQDNVWILSLWP